MEYREFIQQVRDLDFIPNEETADAAVKAVLGIFSSALREPQAKRLTEKLPGPLTFDELRSHQKKVALAISVKDYIEEIRDQFDLSMDQAKTLIVHVMHLAKMAAGEEVMNEAMSVLPNDWDELIKMS